MDYKSGVPSYAERKGSLLLRSNNCSFRTGVLNTNWHQMREAEPKDYDISSPKNYNLHTSTYHNTFGIHNGKQRISEMKERMADLHKKEDFERKDNHKLIIDQDALNKQVNRNRLDKYELLTRHAPHHNLMFLNTTNREDYKPAFDFKPVEIKNVSIKPQTRWRKTHSELYDTSDHRRFGMNTWQDEYRVLRNEDGPSSVIKGLPMKTGGSRRGLHSVASRYSR